MPKKVLLLYGGFSAEREVSISSKNDIAAALQKKGYTVIEQDLNDIWTLLQTLKNVKPDVIYNGLYGNWGEDGELQGMFDMLQIPYTHSGLSACVLSMNKNLTKLVARQHNVKTAKDECMTFAEYKNKGTVLPYPYVVKPVSDGSSVGVFIVKNEADKTRVHYNSDNQKLLVEEYIGGRELTVMCLNGKAYVVTELKAKNEFYDYNAKYTNGVTEHILPADIDTNVAETCKKYAEIMHNALHCNTISRSDFRYNPQDGVVFLEINNNPGMTSLSLVPEQAKFIGISYEDLCDSLVKNATCRKREKP